MARNLANRLDNIKANLDKWDAEYAWPEHGDEWKGQADVCRVPYEYWKHSLIEHLIAPFGGEEKRALEIAPGHGRWTEALIGRFGGVTLVDLSPKCLAFCRQRFPGAVDTFVSDGSSLPAALTGQVDFVFCYDAYVHMAPDVIAEYVQEIARVLKPGGMSVAHHADVADPETHQQAKSEGWRSAMTAAMMGRFAGDAGLEVVSQFTWWDDARKIGVPRFGDKITVLRKPA